jgi:hypothetical protein
VSDERRRVERHLGRGVGWHLTGRQHLDEFQEPAVDGRRVETRALALPAARDRELDVGHTEADAGRHDRCSRVRRGEAPQGASPGTL